MVKIIIKRWLSVALSAVRNSKWYLKELFTLGSADETYVFSRADLKLYFKERRCRLKKLEILDSRGDLIKVGIGETIIFWPSQVPPVDLPWLFHEVFDSFHGNPSSYDHPSIEYDNLSYVIDAGAAEGFFSIFASTKTPAYTQLIALEPLSIMLSALNATFQLRQVHNVCVKQAALGCEEGLATFVLDPEHICDSKLSVAPSQGDNLDVETVKVTTLDILAKELKLTGRGLVKMDIEGSEIDALVGATTLLSTLKPYLAIAVYHEYRNAKLCADIITTANPSYKVEFRGWYGYFTPARPYLLFAS